MKNIDKIAALFFGIYLIAVTVNGNSTKLVTALEAETPFVKWAIALAILVFIADYTKSEIAEGFVYITIVAMVLSISGNGTLQTAAAQIDQIFGAKTQ